MADTGEEAASYDGQVSFTIPAGVRGYAAEPAIADPPVRVWRDWALVGAASLAAIGEALFRTDNDWVTLSVGWQVASLALFFLTVPAALMARRTHPLAATFWAFIPTMAFGVAVAAAEGVFGGLIATAVMLVVPYALYRWGSGRDGLIGAGVLLAAWCVGNLSTPEVTLGDWIGGFIVLTIPVEAGLVVRYQRSARERAVREVRARERGEIARELHDTVAHHVSAIAVQAQAGRALAPTDPERALDVLAVIEEAASRTLAEMRSIVTTLREDADVELAPDQGVADLDRLARQVAGGPEISVDVDPSIGKIGRAADAALFRIGQESLTNAVRHAEGATAIEVRVEAAGDAVRLVVVDNGRASGPRSSRGLGLVGMAERAELLGGHFTAGPIGRHDGEQHSGQGGELGGWRVVAELPREPSTGRIA